MRAKKSEEEFLNALKLLKKVKCLNKTIHNVDELIEKFEVCDPPDFVFENHYAERFEVDSYEKIMNKNGKLASQHLHQKNQLQRRQQIPQNIFRVAHFQTPNTRSNTRYLKENIEYSIEQKTKKQNSYNLKHPKVKYKHIVIDVKDYCQIYVDKHGQYYDKIVDNKNLRTEMYEVYKDLNFIESLKKKYSSYWDVLIFVKEYNNLGNHNYLVHCIDLKNQIEPNNMILYPTALFQIVKGNHNLAQSQGGVSTTNIKYSFKNERNLLYGTTEEIIEINGLVLTRSEIDSIYATEDEVFYLETSQVVIALNPDSSKDLLEKYIPYVLKEELYVRYKKTEYILQRESPLDTYYFERYEYSFYKLTSNSCLKLSNWISK